LANGELLRKAASEGFDAFITADQNLQYQRNISKSNLGVIVLAARSNRLSDLKALVPKIKQSIETIKHGQIVRITP
jgi:hypothetical protein